MSCYSYTRTHLGPHKRNPNEKKMLGATLKDKTCSFLTDRPYWESMTGAAATMLRPHEHALRNRGLPANVLVVNATLFHKGADVGPGYHRIFQVCPGHVEEPVQIIICTQRPTWDLSIGKHMRKIARIKNPKKKHAVAALSSLTENIWQERGVQHYAHASMRWAIRSHQQTFTWWMQRRPMSGPTLTLLTAGYAQYNSHMQKEPYIYQILHKGYQKCSVFESFTLRNT